MKSRLINILASPYFVAIPVAVVLILLLPISNSLYKIELKEKLVANKKDSHVVFSDLNNDGIDEQILFFHNNVKNQAAVKVLSDNFVNYDVWNFNGIYQKASTNFFIEDLNNDKLLEIYVIYSRNDSVFMSVGQPYPDKEHLLTDKFITTIDNMNGEIDYTIDEPIVYDLNNDGWDELIFDLKAGFSLQPRILISYDRKNNQFNCSKSTGAFINLRAIADLNNDGHAEIYCGSSSTANIHDSLGYKYNDYSSWLMIFDKNMNLIKDPVENPGLNTSINLTLFKDNNKNDLIAILLKNATNNQIQIEYLSQNETPLLTKTIDFNDDNLSKQTTNILFIPVYIQDKNYILLMFDEENFTLIDAEGNIRKIKKSANITSFIKQEDFDCDRNNEFLFMNIDGKLIIFDENLQHPTLAPTNISPFELHKDNIGIKHNGDEPSEIYLGTSDYLYLFSYEIDYQYYLKYLYWLIIYTLTVLFFKGVIKVQNIQQIRKKRIEETINSLQYKTIKSQIDPHFMFNVLNGLAINVANSNTEEAYNQILMFSHLLRQQMTRIDKLNITLKEEIEFVESYLALEKFRFKDDFEYKINILNDVNLNFIIPRMLIQFLAENSIKHGLKHLTSKKQLTISISGINNVIITVEDNGIGRKEAAKYQTDSGQGLQLLNKLIRLHKKTCNKEITFEYIDLKDDEGNSMGTRVVVWVEGNKTKN